MRERLLFPIVLGTDYYGKTIPEETAIKLLNIFHENGGRIIDTAHVYSDYLPGEKHMSEKVIGRWLASLKFKTEERPIIATKGGFPEIGDMHASRISYKEIRQDLEESLECLGVNCIDLYWLHRDNTAVSAEDITEWMNEFVRLGLIKSYGYSNWKTKRIEASLKYAEAKGLTRPAASQIRWSLAALRKDIQTDDTTVEMDAEEYKWYETNTFTVFAYSSQAKGFFSKIKNERGRYILPGGKAGDRYSSEYNLKTYERLCKICDKYGISPAKAAVSWLLHAPFPVYPIVGCRNENQLTECMDAAKIAEIQEFTDQLKIFQH